MNIKIMKVSIWIIVSFMFFHSISFSQNNKKHNVFIKAQLLPSVGINYKITDYVIFRHAFLIATDGLIGNAALIVDIYKGNKFTYYLGSNYSVDISESLDFKSMGFLIGAELPLKNKFELFGELGVDVSTGENLEGFHFAMTGIGIKYYLGK